MSGHSKWHKIKNQKAANDPKKGKLFTQYAKLIAVAAREGGADPDMNPTLRRLIDDAKAANLPKENIQRAINKGAGIGKGGTIENLVLEGYGPGGVAVMIEISTDNRNRIVSEVRKAFKDSGGSLGEPGCAAYVFGDDPENPQFRTQLNAELRSKFDSLIEELEKNDDIIAVVTNIGEP